MNLEYFFPALNIRVVYGYLTVETTRAQKRLVENIGAVCSRHYYNALISAEAIHFNKQLVKSLLALIVTAAETRTALTAYSVNLVNKYNSRSLALCLAEKVAHARSAHAYEHFNEIRTGN